MVSPETTTSSSNPTSTTTAATAAAAAANSMLHRFLLSSNPINSNFINNPFGFGPLFRPENNITSFTYPEDYHHQHQSLQTAATAFPITGPVNHPVVLHQSDDHNQSAAQDMGHNTHNNRHLTDHFLEETNPGNDNTTTSTTTHSNNNHLSLSLSSHHQVAGGFIQYSGGQQNNYLDSSGEETTCCASNSTTTGFMGLSNEYSSSSFTLRNSSGSTTGFTAAVRTTDQGSMMNRFCYSSSSSFSAAATYSKYLRPAQLLLEEMISLGGRDLELNQVKNVFFGGTETGISSTELRDEFSTTFADGSVSPEKQELQIKMSKLIALLEQVEIKYQEYCNRMDDLVTTFETIAGEEAAKTYTAVALQAMCRHFCNLREGILAQIRSIKRRNLQMISSSSPEFPRIRAGLSNLSLFDTESSSSSKVNNRAVMPPFQQQIGKSTRVWRPIRGLPETSVAILRAWLFEHFLHPYPNESEKLILASQTGLTKNQVSNWFINARVRLWKPMIEEMYKDEFGDQSSSADSDPLFSSTTCCSTRDE